MDTRALAAQARELGRAGFAAKHPNLFLMMATAPPSDEAAPFWTDVVDEESAHGEIARTTRVAPLVKREGNPYPDRISIGRARNCDIVIADPSVSKLHAHARAEAGGWVLVDLGSHNRTRVGGQVLMPHQPSPLCAGDDLTIGNVKARVFDAPGLFDALAQLGGWR